MIDRPDHDRARLEGPQSGGETLILQVDLEMLAGRVAALVAAALGESLAPARSPWLDVAGAAEHLTCSPERLRKLVQRRAIPFHQDRAGGRIFFHRRELDEWLLGQ